MNKLLKISMILLLLSVYACKNKNISDDNSLPKPSVSIVHPVIGNIEEELSLNGQIVYLNKVEISSPISGYVIKVNTKIGDWVPEGKLLFKIQTKESLALKNTDTLMSKEMGTVPVYATTSGYINTLNVQDAGIFITEGSPMVNIVKNTDLVIQVNTPFQYSKLFKKKELFDIELPDSEILKSIYFRKIPYVDPVSQTQKIYLKLLNKKSLPENLNVLIKIKTKEKRNAVILPADVVLTNETQDLFWIMKVINDSVAVKIPVITGIKNADKIEIVKPKLKSSTIIINKGAYGLPDSSTVKIND